MEERIKYLFRKYLNNTCTKEEFDELFVYLQIENNDLIIKEIFQEISGNNLPQPSSAYVDEFGKLSIVTGLRQNLDNGKKKSTIKKSFVLVSAILVIAFTAGFLIISQQRKRISLASNTYADVIHIKKTTERSEYKYLLLPDSTQVWLNAASSLEFPESFSKNKREVTLQGEAYFDVKHADKIPFIIYTGKVSTVVLGTAFNIKAYPGLEKITVSVQRGKVRVNYVDKQVALLTKGEEVSIGNTDNVIKEKKMKVEEAAAWHEGELVYDDYTIGDILADLERVYDVTIHIESLQVKNLHISTAFKRTQGVDKALEILCKLTDTELRQDNGVYTIR